MPADRRPAATRWFALNAALAWAGLAVSLTLDVLGTYPTTVTVASHYGYAVPDGFAGSTQRVADWVSYFTIWSNLTVAIVMTVLALGRARPTRWLRAARLDSVADCAAPRFRPLRPREFGPAPMRRMHVGALANPNSAP